MFGVTQVKASHGRPVLSLVWAEVSSCVHLSNSLTKPRDVTQRYISLKFVKNSFSGLMSIVKTLSITLYESVMIRQRYHSVMKWKITLSILITLTDIIYKDYSTQHVYIFYDDVCVLRWMRVYLSNFLHICSFSCVNNPSSLIDTFPKQEKLCSEEEVPH